MIMGSRFITHQFSSDQRRLTKKEKYLNPNSVSVLQNGWETLGPFHVLVLYEMDG